MKVEIKPTENAERLVENLKKRSESVKLENGTVEIQTEDTDWLQKVPGIESFKVNGEKKEGIGGRPVEKQVYAKLESREDAVRCLLATIEGYDLRVLDTERIWDLRQLKKYNPDIKHLKFDEPKKSLGIKSAIFDSDDLEKVEIEMPDEEESTKIYREFLT